MNCSILWPLGEITWQYVLEHEHNFPHYSRSRLLKSYQRIAPPVEHGNNNRVDQDQDQDQVCLETLEFQPSQSGKPCVNLLHSPSYPVTTLNRML